MKFQNIPQLQRQRKQFLRNLPEEVLAENKFRGSGVIPLGTLRHFREYPNGIVPEDEIVTLQYRPKEPMHVALIAKTGYFKSVIMKNFAYFGHHQNAKVLFIDNKGRDSALMTQKGSGIYLPKDVQPDSLPAKIHIPSTISRFFDLMPSYIKKNSELFSVSLKKILGSDYARLYFKTLGISPLVLEKMIEWGRETGSIDKIYNNLLTGKIVWTAKDSALTRLINVKNDFLFSNKFPKVDINTDWDNNMVSTFAFMEQDVRYSQFILSSVLEDVFRRATTHRHRNESKLILVDDADMVAPANREEGDILSLKFLKEGVTKWRDLFAQFCFATQSPELLHPSILGNCKYYIIGKVSNPDALRPIVSDLGIIWAVRDLKYSVAHRVYQYILVEEDGTTFTPFFPFSCVVGHTF